MDTSIPWLGVVLAALSAFPIGSFWYSPAGFLTPWMKMVGSNNDEMKKRFGPAMGVIAVASLLTAYVLAHFIRYSQVATGTTGIASGLETALWSWLGISLTTVLASGIFEPRSSWVMVITAGNRLVTLLVMGLILGAFM